jgi:transposase
MATKRKKPRKKQKNLARKVPPFPVEFREKIARLHVEDGYPAPLIAQKFNISEYSVYRWGKRYREFGRQGLADLARKKPGSKMPEAIKQTIVDLKGKTRSNPGFLNGPNRTSCGRATL